MAKPKKPRPSRAKGTGKSASHGRRHGKPAHKPTNASRACVAAMAKDQIPHEAIAEIVKCAPDTLRRHYAAELDGGNAFTKGFVMAALIRKAGDGDVQAQKFYLERRGGTEWRETSEVAHTGDVVIEVKRGRADGSATVETVGASVTPVPDVGGGGA